MLSMFFKPRYSTVLNEKSNNLLPIFSRRAAVNHYILYSVWGKYSARKKHDFFCAQVHCIEFTVPRTNFSTKQLRGKNALLQSQNTSTLS